MLEILDKTFQPQITQPESSPDTQGLTGEEAARRLKINGLNKLSTKKKQSAAKIFAGQFHDFMVMILLGATVISIILGEFYDAGTILLIVLINAVLGFIQEYRTENTLLALEKMTAPTAKVYRDGKLTEIPAEEVAEGDVFLLEAGDRIPADGYILSCSNFSCDESVLNGESVPAEKIRRTSETDFESINCSHMAYMGTVAVKGTAKCLCTSTGLRTQMGKVSGMIRDIPDELTPLQKKLDELGKVLGLICIGVCVLVFAAGLIRGESFFTMFMTGITIAIAAIPEGLPAAVTIALALAVRRMLKKNALVHKLHSVETLGCASVICTDKTGTVTENKMTVCKVFTANHQFEFTGTGYSKNGDVKTDGIKISPENYTVLTELLTCAVVCSNGCISEPVYDSSKRNRNSRGAVWEAVGDPTETALLVAGAKAGIFAEKSGFQRISEIPFDSKTRFMSVTARDSLGKTVIFTKGAVDVVLKNCGYILSDKGETPLTDNIRKLILKANDSYALQAYRVLAFSKQLGHKIVFLGLCAMEDPIRPEAKKAIRKCEKAHIKTVMITGDHKLTACAVASQAGILKDSMRAMTGDELSSLSDSELDGAIENTAVFARVTPDHKLRIVKAFKRHGYIVAMTGDGVNDAPAIKEASIGVSMGITGTDVTKQAADLILLDDNFSTLVSAVEEGRTIYSNIRKFVRYLLSCNIGEVVTMFLSILMGLPLILLPTQILLVNLVTDGLPAIGLGLEPTEKNIMSKPPRKNSDSFFSGGLLGRIVFRGILIGLFTICSFVLGLRFGGDIHTARTCALFTLIASQLIHVFECKSEERSLFNIHYLNNIFLVISVIISLLCLVAAIYIPFLQTVFSTVPLNSIQLLCSTACAALVPVLSSAWAAVNHK